MRLFHSIYNECVNQQNLMHLYLLIELLISILIIYLFRKMFYIKQKKKTQLQTSFQLSIKSIPVSILHEP